MQQIKKMSGILMMILAPALLFLLIYGAWANINPLGKDDINKPIPWVIIIGVFTPIAIGLFIFGYYAITGAYDDQQ